MGDWAAAMVIEAVYIDKDTTIRNELRWNKLQGKNAKYSSGACLRRWVEQ